MGGGGSIKSLPQSMLPFTPVSRYTRDVQLKTQQTKTPTHSQSPNIPATHIIHTA